MAETEEEKTEASATEEAPAEEAETPEKAEKAPVIWSQQRVPNIKKGYDPTVPFYMMGIFAALIVLSVIFAKITS